VIADRVSAALLFLFSVFVIVEARTLPYWTSNSPGPGFLPFWLGVLLACASIALLRRPEGPPHSGSQPIGRLAAIVGLTAAAAGLTSLIGMVLATGVFMAAMLVYLRPQHVLANAIAALLTPVLVWLLFVRWLTVPLPIGPFGF